MPSIDTTAAATTAAAVAAPSPPTTTGSPTRIRGSIVAHLDTDTPAINASPVEIDGTPTTSPTQTQQQQEGEDKPAQQSLQQQLRGYKRGGSAGAGAVPSRSCSAGSSPDHLAREEEVLEEFGLGARGPGGENRAALLQLRKSDPAVLVDIPQGPSVEDFAAAGLLGPDPEEKKVGVAS